MHEANASRKVTSHVSISVVGKFPAIADADHRATLPVTEALPRIDNGRMRINRCLADTPRFLRNSKLMVDLSNSSRSAIVPGYIRLSSECIFGIVPLAGL